MCVLQLPGTLGHGRPHAMPNAWILKWELRAFCVEFGSESMVTWRYQRISKDYAFNSETLD